MDERHFKTAGHGLDRNGEFYTPDSAGFVTCDQVEFERVDADDAECGVCATGPAGASTRRPETAGFARGPGADDG